ncbi:hypothetical protein EJB05_12935, partial [Eragrostis curvula]
MVNGGHRGAAAGASRDLISTLHDDLLLTILLRVPTIEAIRTCALSHRWRALWTRLPELTFNDKDAGIQRLGFADLVDGALHRSGPCDLSSLEVSVYCDYNVDAAARVPAWILAAAPRATGNFRIWIMAQRDGKRVPRERDDMRVLHDLPCLPRAKNISLANKTSVLNLRLRLSIQFNKNNHTTLDLTAISGYSGSYSRRFKTLNKAKNNAELRLPGPDAGAFACLTALELNSLHLTDGGANLGDLVSSRCPQLERLQLSVVSGLTELSILAEKLLQLDLVILDLERLSLVASKLRVLHLFACFGTGGKTLSVQAPMLEDLAWFGVCPEDMRFDAKRKLRKLVVGGCKLGSIRFGRSTRHAKFLQHFSHTDFLKLQISLPMCPQKAKPEPSLLTSPISGKAHVGRVEEHRPIDGHGRGGRPGTLETQMPLDIIGHKRLMEEIKFPHHLGLELQIDPNGHAFGSSVASLLKRCKDARSFPLVDLCSAECLCDYPASWRDERFCFNFLEDLEFNGFMGTAYEMDFLIFIITRSNGLKEVLIAFGKDADLIKNIQEIREEIVNSVPAGCLVVFRSAAAATG